MKLYYFILFAALVTGSAANINATTADYVYSVTEIIAALRESGDDVYRADYFFKTVENLVYGLPIQVVSALVNAVCSTVLAQARNRTPDRYAPRIEDIGLQFRTACSAREYPITDIAQLAEDPDFDPNKKTVIFSSGWLSTLDYDWTALMSKAFNCRGDTNFLVLNTGGYIGTLYIWSAQNTDTIGKYLAEGIQSLAEFIDIGNLHIIGHSLGAQIMAATARYYTDLTDEQLPHVTGLDPASPCFNEGQVLTVLSASDAQFVDNIITTPGVAGQYAASADATFYVGGLFPLQDPCSNVLCSHMIAIDYYVESVFPNNERNFLAKRCTSLYNLLAGRCNGNSYPMGLAVPHDLSGRYILEVNEEKPYGQNATEDYMDPDATSCGLCQEE